MTAAVVRRQDDGSWRHVAIHVVDHPYASLESAAAGTVAGAGAASS